MRVVRAFRLPITAIMTALALSGCMRTAGPVAVAPQGDLDAMAYGRLRRRPPSSSWTSGGGAIGALRSAFAASPRSAPPPVVMAAPVGLCRTGAGALRRLLSSRCRRQAARRGLRPGRPHQHLRDRCRRLDHDAADRLGAGARPHDRGAGGRDRSETAQRASSGIPPSRSRSKPIGRSLSSAKSPHPGSIPTCRT